MRFLILFLIIVPAGEIALLMLSGQVIGVWPTVLIILSTGVIGAYLAKRQGMATLYEVQRQLQTGQVPGEALLDGICILVGGTLLLTPGFITDTFGFLLLFPTTRIIFKNYMKKWFKNWIYKGRIKIIN
ncbi:FxsA family protein [Neobacillus sp. D3-1R]|uniref:FxsA family protein n=1 Tax=Neobacillus sp. D3-1R TaxID=3445778 RepID=UPI003FA133A6